jgi:hypothetical protein
MPGADDPFANENYFDFPPDEDPHYTAVGRVATAWAMYENLLDRAFGFSLTLRICKGQHGRPVAERSVGAT